MDDDGCECICNHSGACTGCGICLVRGYNQHLEQQIRAFFDQPRGLPHKPAGPEKGQQLVSGKLPPSHPPAPPPPPSCGPSSGPAV